MKSRVMRLAQNAARMGEEKCIQGFGGKAIRIESTRKA
jgi:hypothetical protein